MGTEELFAEALRQQLTLKADGPRLVMRGPPA